ncbi:MAG TPA: tRNA 2-thiouridine(34) synthase MnmA [Myxococcota bacterium]|nr:tRNA 2-thiouridine(34) synthase MnmA [Myxococcota bacterium]
MSARRVVVAMSGGVDSSVAAALVVERGDEAIGVTMNLAGSSSRCCSLEDADDARLVADRLGMRFYVANYRERFQREVIDEFARAYLAGRTPIPCVACNQSFKFEYLLERAKVFGASAVASGHYARVDRDPETGLRRLRRAVDSHKDQTYFLFGLSQAQLCAADFPLGAMTKAEVRERARSLGLATAEKPESQEICFVPDGDYAGAVERAQPGALPGEGEIIDAAGRVLGRHRGIHRYTVGQRRGLGIASERRLYVTAIDAERNRVVVGGERELEAPAARIERVSWIAGVAPPPGTRAEVRIRHQHAPAPARLEPGAEATVVRFDAPVSAIAPGQAAVFYRGDVVLGGGWIAGAAA